MNEIMNELRVAKEKKRVYDKNYREAHKEEIAERAKKYRERNKEILAEKKKEYYENNKEMLLYKFGKLYRETKKTLCSCGHTLAYRYNKETHEQSIKHVIETIPTMEGQKVFLHGNMFVVEKQTDKGVKLKHFSMSSTYSGWLNLSLNDFKTSGGKVIL